MRMQVILNSLFARPGSALIGGGKKGEFRDWTMINLAYKMDRDRDRNRTFALFRLKDKGKRSTLHTSQVAHQAGAYPGFCSMKRLGVFQE